MIICHCHGITDRAIRHSVSEGASTPAQVARHCTAGGNCGGCRPAIQAIIDREDEEPGGSLLSVTVLAQTG